MVNFIEPQGEVCLYTVQDSCLVLNGQIATTHNHTDVEDFPHLILVIHIIASFWLLAEEPRSTDQVLWQAPSLHPLWLCGELCFTEPHTPSHFLLDIWAYNPSQNELKACEKKICLRNFPQHRSLSFPQKK